MTTCTTFLDVTLVMMPKTVHKNLAADVMENLEYYQKVLFVVMQMESTSVTMWLEEQFLKESHSDEWTVFCLSMLYNRHTMIHNKKHAWCTIEEGGNWDYEAACDTHLLYMGNNMYSELLPKNVTHLNLIPNLLLSTPPLPSYQQDQHLEKDNAHQEPAIDTNIDTEGAEFPNSVPDPDLQQNTTPRNNPENTDYNSNLDQMLLKSSKSNNRRNCLSHPQCQVSGSPAAKDKQVTELSTTLAVLKRPCNVNLQRLTDTEINEWMQKKS